MFQFILSALQITDSDDELDLSEYYNVIEILTLISVTKKKLHCKQKLRLRKDINIFQVYIQFFFCFKPLQKVLHNLFVFLYIHNTYTKYARCL